ncbi:MAG TPA: protein kinase, partial [Archangium sp.]|nr:protein kinase [Archangium sp.]
MSGRQIASRYLLERKVAGGGMGAIWVALDTQLQRRIALKLMAPERVSSSVARYQFEQEAKAIAQLGNPHVVQVHDYGVDGDTPY